MVQAYDAPNKFDLPPAPDETGEGDATANAAAAEAYLRGALEVPQGKPFVRMRDPDASMLCSLARALEQVSDEALKGLATIENMRKPLLEWGSCDLVNDP